MKSPTISPQRPILPMGLILALVVSPLGAVPAMAENPFRIIGAKAKAGLTKVTRAVSPRRVGTALKQVKTVAVQGKDKVRGHLVEAPAAYFRGTDNAGHSSRETWESTTYVYPETQAASSRTVSFSTQNNSRGSALSSDTDVYTTESDYYTSGRYRSGPSTSPVSQIPVRSTSGQPILPRVYPTPTSIQARESLTTPMPDAPQSPVQETRVETQPANAAPNPVSPPVSQAPGAAAPREDLPFGLLVPGREGMVHSPYSDKQLVDVSGIPTGTKVKCPYSGKTFRVP